VAPTATNRQSNLAATLFFKIITTNHQSPITTNHHTLKVISVFERGKRHQMLRELKALQHNLVPLNQPLVAVAPASKNTRDTASNECAGVGGNNADGDGSSDLQQQQKQGRGLRQGPNCNCMVSFFDAFMDPKVSILIGKFCRSSLLARIMW